MTICLRHKLRSLLLFALLLVAAGKCAAGKPRYDAKAKTDSLKRALATTSDTARVKILHLLMEQAVDEVPAMALTYAQQGLAESKRLGWQRG